MYLIDFSWTFVFFFFSSRRRHTRFKCDWSSDVCSSDLELKRPGVNLLMLWDEYRAAQVAMPALRPGFMPMDTSEMLFNWDPLRSEERREGKSVDLGGRRIIKKKKSERKTL